MDFNFCHNDFLRNYPGFRVIAHQMQLSGSSIVKLGYFLLLDSVAETDQSKILKRSIL